MSEELSLKAIRAMSPAEAKAELDRRTEAYGVSQTAGRSARELLDAWASDAGVAAKLFAGDVATLAEFRRLTANVAEGEDRDVLTEMLLSRDPAAPPMIEMVAPGEMPVGETLSHINALRDAGVGDAAIAEAFLGVDSRTGKPWQPGMVAQARAQRAMRMADPEWTDRLMAGGLVERRELTDLNIIIAGGS